MLYEPFCPAATISTLDCVYVCAHTIVTVVKESQKDEHTEKLSFCAEKKNHKKIASLFTRREHFAKKKEKYKIQKKNVKPFRGEFFRTSIIYKGKVLVLKNLCKVQK
jgi:hypothetical protein